ncbi:MAG: PDZ domain-containing protein [Opitutales bacterium]
MKTPLLLLTGLLVLLTGCSRSQEALVIHVAPGGDDAAAGDAAAPLRTLQEAQTRARTYAGRVPVTVLCADGTYYLDEPLVLTARDSGTAGAPVVYRAQNEGQAVLSGGLLLDLEWQPYRDGIQMAATPEGLDLDQLFVNGVRQHMARYPNYDPANKDVPYRGSAADAFAPERVATWSKPAGGYIHAMHAARWGGYHFRITGKSENGELEYEGGWQNNRPSKLHGKARMVENIFEELDAPGEWFHDKATNTLYFYPPEGMDLPKARVEGVRLATLVELRGSQAEPVRHVTVDGFTMRHTRRTFMQNREPLLRSDWTIHRSGAVFFEGTEDCALLNCTVDQAGANAVFVNNYNRRARLAGLHVHGAGASGVAFVGDPDAVRNPVFQYGDPHDVSAVDPQPGPKSDNYPVECVLVDSLVHEIGLVEKQAAGVQIAMSRRITVRDCSIYDTSRAGINIGDGTWGGHLVEGCDVFNTVLETSDHGSFNSWGRDRFWLPKDGQAEVIAAVRKNPDLPFLDAMEPNVIRLSRWRCDHGWDVDLDDGSSNYLIEKNLMLNRGLKLREGYRRIAVNNIMVNNTLHPHVWYPDSEDVFKRNIVMQAYRPIWMYDHWDGEIDQNWFTTSEADRTKFAQYGADANSVVGDPQFADPSSGDFTVQNTELAQQIGFENFPMDQFGVKKPSLKKIARTPVMPEVEIEADAGASGAEAKTARWSGARLGEPKGDALSAYGASFDDGGVGVVALDADSPLAGEAGLQRGDLIQAANGQQVSGIADLRRALKTVKGEVLELQVLRSQRPVQIQLRGWERDL